MRPLTQSTQVLSPRSDTFSSQMVYSWVLYWVETHCSSCGQSITPGVSSCGRSSERSADCTKNTAVSADDLSGRRFNLLSKNVGEA